MNCQHRIATSPKAFAASAKGNTAIMFALVLPLLLGGAGIGIDFSTFAMKQSSLQTAADASALAGAKQLSLASTQDSAVQSYAMAFLAEELRGKDDAARGTVKVDRKKGTVKVSVQEDWTPFFADFLGAKITPVTATASASLSGESKLCLLTLETQSAKGLAMQQQAHLQATGCGVYSNSRNPTGIFINDAATIDAATICSAGGSKNKGGSTTVPVTTDCPPLADPLASHPLPVVGGCDYTNTNLRSGNIVLKPGVYCGGIDLAKNVSVTFTSGNYVLKDGQFKVAEMASVSGKDVSFYFTGAKSFITFTDDASISLSGAETGDMAGILFFNNPASSSPRTHVISATNANILTGTIYLPNSSLRVDPNSTVGQNSAYTSIIVNKISIEQGPNLILNTDYGATAVPVPEGIQSNNTVVLIN